MDFTKKELIEIMADTHNDSIKKKAAKLAGLSALDLSHTYFIYPDGKISKKFSTSKKAHDFVEKIVGKWSLRTAKKWRDYFFVDVEYGNEDSYTY